LRQEGNSQDFVPSQETSPWGTKTFSKMKLDIQPLSDEILSIALWSPQHHHHHPPSVFANESIKENQLKYEIKVFKPELFIEIRRKLDNRVIFSTSRGALIVSENYFEWSFHLGAGVQLVAAFDSLRVRNGRRILINNGHSSVIPYVIGFGKYIHRMGKKSLKAFFSRHRFRQ
jgi:N-terminal barrel of NtMGAM and CtMGAM, maltase-glucoamylase